MTTNKNKRTVAGRRAGRKNGSALSTTQLTHRLCSVSDPFCQHSYGAKQPESAPATTIGYTTRATGTLQTSNAGNDLVWLYFRASTSLCNVAVQQPITGTKQFDLQTLITSNMGAHPSFVERTRVVSAGIRLWPIYAMTSLQGTMSVIPINDSAALFDGANHAYSDLLSTQGATVGKMCEFQYTLTPVEDEYTFFKTADATQTVANVDQDWTAVLIGLEGAANTTYMAYECVIHYEGIVSATSGSAIGSMKPETAFEPIVKRYQREAAAAYGGMVDGTRHQVEAILKRKAKAMAAWGLRRAGTAVAGYLGGPAGAAGAQFLLTNGIPEVD